ncbi:MAG: D-alanyl-D-alanine carboxypeptidase [Cyanobacteria bacterium P01_A01_bin.123]
MPKFRWQTGLGATSLGLLGMLLMGSSMPPLRPLALANLPIVPQWGSPWMAQISAPDPSAEAILRQSIAGLGAAGVSVTAQGVAFLAGGGTIAQHQGSVPLPAASLTKLATTLAALKTWEPTQQFETRVGITGSVEGGILQGDLVIRASQDPFFVWEEAIVLANTLQQIGIQRVNGKLIILGNFAMNFNRDPVQAGEFLKQGMNASLWPTEAHKQYGRLPTDTPVPQLQVVGDVQVLPASAEASVAPQWVISHRSLPLVGLLKAMNIYSNNAMADMMAQAVGGPEVMMAIVSEETGISTTEIRLVNGSGLGEGNQISARGVVAMLIALQRSLQGTDYTIADLMPVIDKDGGTLLNRNLPPGSAMKTGSLATVSSLGGVFPTRDRGLVWFAILNRGSNLDGLRARQDQLINALEQHWGAAPNIPAHLQTQISFSQPPYQLGDPNRNQVLE